MSGTNITRLEASERSAVIQAQTYEIELDLTTRDDTFASKTTVHFTAREGNSTWIDFIAPKVARIDLNGESLDIGTHDGFRIPLPNLKSHNVLIVEAEAAYMNTGEGMHRFIDPVDDEVYLYTQFEIADARRVFACFDQPDIKATFAFTITAPDHWKVTSNSATPMPESVRDGIERWRFAPSAKMSTYITAIVAGPYYEVRDDYKGKFGTYPLGLFCRNSLAEYLDPEDLFTVTKQGFKYFEEAFDYGYPFEKYDQLFVPEFNAGAMENAACVTHHESYVFRSKVTRATYEQRANTVLHEMAHMWFGDLVTMKWWDDLWLNESFAEWAAHHASVEATQYTEAWVNFVNQRKSWGYRQDQLPTTHPIVADMFDLDAVEVNFDGITYAKGASALRQLVAWVGEDAFFTGIRAYFKKHAWGNTELQDLLVELEQACGRSLKDWTQRWLQTAGVNTLRPEIVVEGGKYKSVTIVQEPPVSPVGVDQLLRPHHIGIGLYNRTDSKIKRDKRIEIDVDGARTDVPELVGQPVADLMLLNDGDYTFVKIRLDENSAKTSATGLRDIEDGVARALIWGASWDMTRDAEMSASDYLSMVLNTDLGEIEIGVAQQLLLQARSAIEQFANPANRAANRDALLASLLIALAKADAGGDHQLAFVKNIAGLARTTQHGELLASWLDGSNVLAGLEVDTDLRWLLVSRLVSLGVLTPAAIDSELARDNTAGGQRQAASAKAGIPTAAAKLEAWNAVVENDGLANALLEATVGGFSQPDQRELLLPFVDKYFDSLADIWETRTNEISQTLTLGLFPSLLGSPEIMAKADAFIASSTDVGAIRLVRELRDNVNRSLRCQARDGAK
ncbi:MAG: aminopeptidase N [Candidatus Nanopelagicales bacterium]|nr:aminopeptidase N [Candidatus Nanopelagicales bacterium]MDP4895727.1 aminopeptidase N [Candidatus Nanopelagicales bacterium]MDP5050563.1 aminopeptidase N [Candidatus Nanopelagicales bacterium]